VTENTERRSRPVVLCEACRKGKKKPSGYWRCTRCGVLHCNHTGRSGGRLGQPLLCLHCAN